MHNWEKYDDSWRNYDREHPTKTIKCQFRLRIRVRAQTKKSASKKGHKLYKWVSTKWLTGYFHGFFQEGSIDSDAGVPFGNINSGMKVEDQKGHVHSIWRDKDLKLRV